MLMNKIEAAKFLRISTPTLDRHVAAGLIIPVKLGARVFFREKTLTKFIDDCERKARRRAQERADEATL
jgi:predicted site-specific integrase-resolvase